MENALHPYRNEVITVPQYHQEFGHKPLGQTDTRPKCRCPGCRKEMFDKGKSTTGIFSHYPNSGICPTKIHSGHLYGSSQPTKSDQQNAKDLKQKFRKNWREHYSLIRFLTINLLPKEFIELIKLANNQRIWEYAGLKEFHLPYLFVTLADFPSQSGSYKSRRMCWFRFWFDSSVKSYNDVMRGQQPELWQSYYFLKLGEIKPTTGNIKGVKSFTMSDDFLYANTHLPDFIITEMESWFSTYW